MKKTLLFTVPILVLICTFLSFVAFADDGEITYPATDTYKLISGELVNCTISAIFS